MSSSAAAPFADAARPPIPGDVASAEAPARWFPDGLPDALLDADLDTLVRALAVPTLVRLPGLGVTAPRAVSVLLHGDESTGLDAVHRVLHDRRSIGTPLPFDLYVVIGNVRAAAREPGFAHRFLDDEEDLNRIWGLPASTPQRAAAADILSRLEAAGLHALVDIHNNTGDNPFYAILPRVSPRSIALAGLFTTTILRWDLASATLMQALDPRIVTAAIECGLPGRRRSLAFALDGVRRYLGALDLDALAPTDHDLLGDLVKVTLRPDARVRFGGALDDDVDLVVRPDADAANFVPVPAGHLVGTAHPDQPWPLRAHDATGAEVTEERFERDGSAIRLRRPGTPVMMTRTVVAARKDCLFYLANALGPGVDDGHGPNGSGVGTGPSAR
ncbi:MAG: succinylglutamate desuccinylase/aspartoacylase family protein [Nitriliruptoraceae bacterium]|nr:succinylglutamate desuccinylase/aspartoacylase family protein [Nitriliruptoraceae bacterium]